MAASIGISQNSTSDWAGIARRAGGIASGFGALALGAVATGNYLHYMDPPAAITRFTASVGGSTAEARIGQALTHTYGIGRVLLPLVGAVGLGVLGWKLLWD